jgi:hypothetical protein
MVMEGVVMRVWLAALGVLSLLLSGCAGFRGGVESSAYIPGAEESVDVLSKKVFKLPGIDLQVHLDNRLQRRDVQVIFFIVPVMIDLKERFIDNHRPLRTRAYVTVTALEAGVIFRPKLARLKYAGKSYSGLIGYNFTKDGNGRFSDQPVAGEVELTPGHRYLLSIDFETPPPSPSNKDIVLELEDALESPIAEVPPIYFMPIDWSQGYT